MRNHKTSIALVALTLALGGLAFTPKAAAQVRIPQQVSLDYARKVAAMNGMVAIREIEFYDGRWKIRGKDVAARDLKIEINGRTGMIQSLDRD